MKQNWMRQIASFALIVLVSTTAFAQVKDYRDIKYPKLPDFKVEKPEVVTLDNGMTIFLIEDHELPLISVSARIRTGANYEPIEKSGLAGMVGSVMREGGSTSMPGEEMDAYLEARAAFVETGMGGEFGTASMNCLKEDFDDVLKVFVDVLRNPSFAEDKLDLAKQQAKTGISRRNDDIAGIAGREYSRLMYGYDSPLAAMTEYATVAAITRDDLVAWHQRYYHPNNMLLGVSGDFDTAEMKRKIEAAFGSWPKGPETTLPKIPVNKVDPGLYFIEKEDVTQSYIRMGHRGIRRDNPDYYAIQVMNEVFGGGFSARLFSNVRSEKGLAYGVGGGIGAGYVREGLFTVATSTKSETMAAAIDALREEITNIIESPATDAEIKRAKESILNSFVFNYTSRAQILGQQLTYAYYGYPSDYLEQYQKNIATVTKEDVARVAKQYIHPDQLVTLVVGKSADFDRPLSSFGEVTEVDITIPAPEASAPAVTRNAATLKQGAEIFARAAKKLNPGGVALSSVAMDATITLSIGGQQMALGQEMVIAFPDRIRQVFKTPMGEQTMIVNGDQGAVMAGGQRQPIPAADIAEEKTDLNRSLQVLVSSADAVEAVAAGSGNADGEACDLILVSLNEVESTLCVAADGRVLQQSYQGNHPMQGTPGELLVNFTDYREANGFFVPFSQVMTFDGQQLATLEISSFSANESVDDASFDLGE